MRGRVWISLLLGTASCLVGAGCPGTDSSTTNVPAAARSAPPVAICGLSLPCTSVGTPGRDDLYGFMTASAEPNGSRVVVVDDEARGCVSCVAPDTMFAALADDTERAYAVLLHLYVSLVQTAEDAQDARANESPPAPVEGWDGVRVWTAQAVTAASTSHGGVSCSLLTTWCASSREFADAFVAFAAKVLFRKPLDEDPGAVKEMTVKLALALNPPGMLPVIIRFVRSGAHVSARMKAVRDLCGGIAMPEVREVLEWVVAEDPWLRDRAAHCLEGAAER